MKKFIQKLIGLLLLVFTMSFSINAQSPGTACTYNVNTGIFGNASFSGVISCDGNCEANPDLSPCSEVMDFSYTGSPQQWTVPCGVNQIQVEAYGASGGSHVVSGGWASSSGGAGGAVSATISVTPGEILHIYVGGQGQSCSGTGTQSCGTRSGGWNGGGTGHGAGAGGGATDIRIGSQNLVDRVIVAGAGGGSRISSGYTTKYQIAGDGGGLEGENAILDQYEDPACASGGTQTSGGSCDSMDDDSEVAGGFGYGGSGYTSWGAGGGGSGWYGGSGGLQSGGGGGSSYTDTARCSNVVHTQGVYLDSHYGPGNIIISYIIGEFGSCYVDQCGVINGDNSICSDECGVPNGDNSTCSDCSGVPNGSLEDLGCGCGNPAAENGYDCNGECNTDIDGDGVCDEFEVEGCTDLFAFNYDETATDDNGSCEDVVNGCMDSSMSNYSAEANTDNGSCISWEEFAGALQNQLDNLVPEDGITQSDVDAAFADGVASVTPEDGISQADVDAAYASCDEAWEAEVETAFANGVASVEVPECEEVATQNIPLDLPQGWSMFGYTCLEPLDVAEAFSDVSDMIEIVKDEWGLAYLPSYGFSAFDNLEFGEGYQIKMLEEVIGFKFCSTIVGISSQEEPDSEPQLQIGDIAHGGMVFQINEDGTGLVADLQDLGEMKWDWWSAIDVSAMASSQGYDDWYLPSIEELEIMYNTIGNGGPDDNIGGFENDWYWSSSEQNDQRAWCLGFYSDAAGYSGELKGLTRWARAIRAF